MKRVKTLIPSWRERKRYVVFEVLSKSKIKALSDVSKAIWRSHLALCGELGAARSGMMFVDYNPESQKGMLRVSHDQLHHVRASLAMVRSIADQAVVVRTVAASGVLRKAEARYMAS